MKTQFIRLLVQARRAWRDGNAAKWNSAIKALEKEVKRLGWSKETPERQVFQYLESISKSYSYDLPGGWHGEYYTVTVYYPPHCTDIDFLVKEISLLNRKISIFHGGILKKLDW